MDIKLSGLSAVVTGGTAGIGAAIVKALASEGCNVAFCSRRQDHVDAMVSALAGSSVGVAGRAIDVTDGQAFSQWLQEIGKIDILVANVSAVSPDWGQSYKVDIRATVDCVEAALPYLRASKHAAITYIGSLATASTTYDSPGYGAAKAAMAYYMKSLSRELATQGIRVNVVSPGSTFFEGGFWDNVRANAPDYLEATCKSIPMGRLATAEEIARVVAFVSSPAASFVAGANWFVDGAESVPAFPNAPSEARIRERRT